MENFNLSPCLKCDKRYVGCHSKCCDYLSWKSERDGLKAKIDEQIRIENDMISYKRANYEKYRKRNNLKKNY